MQETLRHQKAFEYYYGMGDNRTLRKVAQQFKVSVQSVSAWNKEFEWQKKVKERNEKNALALAKITDKQIVSQDAKYIKIANAAIDVFGASLIGHINHTCEHCGGLNVIKIPKANINASDFAKLVATVKIVLGEGNGGEEHIVKFIDVEPKDRKYIESNDISKQEERK